MLFNELHQGGIRAIIDYDDTVFDNMVVPEDVDPDDIIDHILYKYGDAPLFSPDPSVIKYYIGRWSKRRLPLWERYKAAIEIEYEPLENYDRIEKYKFTHGKKIEYSGTITDTPSGTYQDKRDDTSTDSISADNSSTFEPADKNVLDGKTVRSYEDYQEERTFNNADTASGSDTQDNRIHGNIGTVTSQAMLSAELDIVSRLDLIDYIADDWHAEFNLMIYV